MKSVAATLVAGSIVVAAAVLAYFLQPPRYALHHADGYTYRLDTRTGEVIACGTRGCFGVVAPGQPRSLGSLPGHQP